ncbi:MAG: NAD(P)-dependent dehydrogenase, short-chain alcohol dehydrogenase family, partial [Hyphomicrobiales bacterium]|nr:NAD(P)-dependent dehydrogenase, short-chain alcohol dehydrogenase family [Hyphomicrobiales bacterium]
MDPKDKSPLTRRHFVGTSGAGLAAATATAGAAFAQQPQQQPQAQAQATPPVPLRDPTKAYPQPPFQEQLQPWPGLASKMNPRPDHGEETYRGSGRLAGRKALITGGDSGMGRAAAIAYAREGADVVINYLPDEEPDAREVLELIRAAGRKGTGIPGDLRDEAFCRRLIEEGVRALGGLDILVLNAARQQTRASIMDVSSEDFDATMKTNIYAPFWMIKAAMPHLQPGSVIIGTTSEQAYDPTPDLYDYAQTKAA